MPTLECQGALSDLILQAARQALPKHVDGLITLPSTGARNQPLLPLLVGLLDAAQTVARAVEDNAWDSGQPLPSGFVDGLAEQARALSLSLTSAGRAHNTSGWSLPSMSGKELV